VIADTWKMTCQILTQAVESPPVYTEEGLEKRKASKKGWRIISGYLNTVSYLGGRLPAFSVYRRCFHAQLKTTCNRGGADKSHEGVWEVK